MNLTAKYLVPALAALSFASPLHADDKNAPVVLEPKGAWNIDFAEDKCRLARAFGSQENLQRPMIKAMLQEWDRNHPGRIENIFRAICNVVPSHMLDTELHDFPGLAAVRHLDVVQV